MFKNKQILRQPIFSIGQYVLLAFSIKVLQKRPNMRFQVTFLEKYQLLPDETQAFKATYNFIIRLQELYANLGHFFLTHQDRSLHPYPLTR